MYAIRSYYGALGACPESDDDRGFRTIDQPPRYRCTMEKPIRRTIFPLNGRCMHEDSTSYERSALSHREDPLHWPKLCGAHQGVGKSDPRGTCDLHRITSYNVCYTKLLRSFTRTFPKRVLTVPTRRASFSRSQAWYRRPMSYNFV